MLLAIHKMPDFGMYVNQFINPRMMNVVNTKNLNIQLRANIFASALATALIVFVSTKM